MKKFQKVAFSLFGSVALAGIIALSTLDSASAVTTASTARGQVTCGTNIDCAPIRAQQAPNGAINGGSVGMNMQGNGATARVTQFRSNATNGPLLWSGNFSRSASGFNTAYARTPFVLTSPVAVNNVFSIGSVTQ